MSRQDLSFRALLMGAIGSAAALLACSAVIPAAAQGPTAPPSKAFAHDSRSEAAAKQAIQTALFDRSGVAVAGTSAPTASPWVWAAEQYDAVAPQGPKVLAACVAEHLLVADLRYLHSEDVAVRRKGLGLVAEAARCTSQKIKDHQTAMAIIEAYVLPHIEDADPRPWKYLGKQNVLETVADVYAEAEDAPKFMKTLRMLIDNAPNRNTQDAARLRLAQMHERRAEYAEALDCLDAIDPNEGVGGARALIGDIEKKLKDKQAREK